MTDGQPAYVQAVNALVLRTYFTPDEFWQGPEIGHRLAFGHGHMTWEWQEHARLRGYTHPMMFAIGYRLLALLQLDTAWAIAHSPKIMQGAMAGVCDWYTIQLAKKLGGQATGFWACLLQLVSWFNFYCLPRPYSNSAEAVLTIAALFHWEPIWNTSSGNHLLPRVTWNEQLALFLASLCVVIRPASGALWAAVGLVRLWRLPVGTWLPYLLSVVPILSFVLGGSVALDTYMYGSFTVAPWNFLKFNLLEGKSALFGVQPWHWNFSQGFPAILGATLPFLVMTLCQSRLDSTLLGLTLWSTVALSLSPHKEFRFLLPLLPLAHIYAADALHGWVTGDSKHPVIRQTHASAGNTTVSHRGQAVASERGSHVHGPVAVASAEPAAGLSALTQSARGWTRRKKGAVLLLVLGHVPLGLYVSTVHQRGPMAIVELLAAELQNLLGQPTAVVQRAASSGQCASADQQACPATGPHTSGAEPIAVHFLMPCHSTPAYSHLHVPGLVGRLILRTLDCSPRYREARQMSESDKFEKAPEQFVTQFYGLQDSSPAQPANQPAFIVAYDTQSSALLRLLPQFREVGRVFNTHVSGDSDSAVTHRSIVLLGRHGS